MITWLITDAGITEGAGTVTEGAGGNVYDNEYGHFRPRRVPHNPMHDPGKDPVSSYIQGYANDIQGLMEGGSYSDFTASRNELMDGWYSTIMDSVPFVRNIHQGLLNRDSAKDYMRNNGLTWKDMQGYNTSKLTSGISNNLGGALATGSKYLTNIANDLGKLYSKE